MWGQKGTQMDKYNYMVTLECRYGVYTFYVQVSTWIDIAPDSEQATSDDGTLQDTLQSEAVRTYITHTGAQQPDHVWIEDWYEA